MLCPRCNNEVFGDHAFCQTCGAPLTPTELQVVPPESTEAIFAAAPAPVFSPAPAEQVQAQTPSYTPEAPFLPAETPPVAPSSSVAPPPPPNYIAQTQPTVPEYTDPAAYIDPSIADEPTQQIPVESVQPISPEPTPPFTAVEAADAPSFSQPEMHVSAFQEAPPSQPEYEQYPAPEQSPGFYQEPYQTPLSSPVPETEATPKSKKKRNTIIAVVGGVLVIALAVVGILGFMEYSRSNNYDQATTLMSEGSYQAALDKFNELGDYQDSETLAAACQEYLDYYAARALMDDGEYEQAQQAFMQLSGFEDSDELVLECQHYLDYEDAAASLKAKDYTGALDQFKTLANENFLDSADKVKECKYALADQLLIAKDYSAALEQFKTLANDNYKDSGDKVKECKYALADQLLAEGKRYEAYKAFAALGNYNDAPAKATSCALALPGNGELYHNGDFAGSSCELTVKSNGITKPYLLKLYCGDALVSTMFVHPESSVTISLPANTYRIKAAYGDTWFGDADLFGDDGDYYIMTFDSAGTETMSFEPNYAYTLDLKVSTGGNVGSKNAGRESF